MKKTLFSTAVLGLFLSGCLPAFLQPAPASPAPEGNLQATAAILSQQTLEALPTPTIAPSNTSVVKTATSKEASPTPTPENDASTTLSATKTPPHVVINTTTTFTFAPNSGSIPTATETLHPRFYGTLPPNLPYGKVILINKSKSQAYISLQCTTLDGHRTIIEYPVPRIMDANIPAGWYDYVAWVGGNQTIGSFRLSVKSEIVITIYRDRIEIK